MSSRFMFLLSLVFLSSLASAADQCPKLDATNRDQVLSRFFQVKPDPVDPVTVPQQDKIFGCLEKLINKEQRRLAGKTPNLETMKRLVLWTTKAYQYNNDEYAGDVVYDFGKELFQPNAKLAKIALQQLLDERTLTKEDADAFKQGTGLN